LPRGRVHDPHPGRGGVPLRAAARHRCLRPHRRSSPMSAPTSAPAPTVPVRPVGLGRVLRSEWIKLWSLRSTYWTIALTLLAMLMLALLMAFAAGAVASEGSFAPDEVGLDGLTVLGTAYGMAQLVIAVLGVLVVPGESST